MAFKYKWPSFSLVIHIYIYICICKSDRMLATTRNLAHTMYDFSFSHDANQLIAPTDTYT